VQFQGFIQLLKPLAPRWLPKFPEASVDPANLHAVAFLVHLIEEVQILVHLHQVFFPALVYASQGGLVHGQHVGFVQFDGLLEEGDALVVLPTQELEETQFH